MSSSFLPANVTSSKSSPSEENPSRLEPRSPSHITRLTLENPQIRDGLVLMEQITSSCRGPFGYVKMVQNSVGGHLTVTSTSTRLLNAMSFSNPIIKIIVSSIQGHLKRFQDGGHFLMSMSLNLVLESLNLDISRRVMADLYEVFLGICLEYLGGTESNCIQTSVVVSDIKQMSSIVKSILRTKPLCKLSHQSLKFCSNLLLETFLTSLPDSQAMDSFSDRVYMVSLEGEPVGKSTLLHGLLLQSPEIASYSVQTLPIHTAEEHGDILVAVVTVSMSGDTDEVGTMKFEAHISIDTDDFFLHVLEEFCNQLVASGVGLLLCQRVVHPRLKRLLRDHSILVVDRLGLAAVPYIQDVSGAVPVRSFQKVNSQMFGRLATVEHRILQDKSYLLLTPVQDRCTVTLVLYSPDDEQLAELKALCSTCLLTLRHLLHAPRVLVGAGCWETHLAAVLRNKVVERQADIIRQTGCTKRTLIQSCNSFTKTLQKAAMTTGHDGQDHMSDLEYGHLWRLPKGGNPEMDVDLQCACGVFKQKLSKLNFLIHSGPNFTPTDTGFVNQNINSQLDTELKQSDVILDLSALSIAALTSGVLTANTVLSIGQFIQDIN